MSDSSPHSLRMPSDEEAFLAWVEIEKRGVKSWMERLILEHVERMRDGEPGVVVEMDAWRSEP